MIHYLSLRDVAAKSNLAVNTVKGYARKGLLPEADAVIGTHRGWLEKTIDTWLHDRQTSKTTQELAITAEGQHHRETSL